MSSLVTTQRLPFGAPAQTRATAAVIEDARRRQHRRRLLVTSAAVVLAVIAVGLLLGLRSSGQTNRTPVVASSHLVMTLYLRRDTSAGEIKNILSTLRHEYGVGRVTFVSRRAALRTMKQRYPNLLTSVTFNPLTASIDVRLTTDRARPSIVLQAKQLRTVEHIGLSAPSN
jgi:cell division protein FtsX